jgi:hypothetical protein
LVSTVRCRRVQPTGLLSLLLRYTVSLIFILSFCGFASAAVINVWLTDRFGFGAVSIGSSVLQCLASGSSFSALIAGHRSRGGCPARFLHPDMLGTSLWCLCVCDVSQRFGHRASGESCDVSISAVELNAFDSQDAQANGVITRFSNADAKMQYIHAAYDKSEHHFTYSP